MSAGRSRLDQLNIPDEGGDDDANTAQATANKDIEDYMAYFQPIKQGLQRIQKNVAEIEKLKEKDRTVANDRARQELMNTLDKIMGQTTKIGRDIKTQLEQIKEENKKQDKLDKESAKSQMRENLLQTHVRRFHTIMNEYNACSHQFKQNLQDRTRRQLKIVDSSITDEDVERIVASGEADGVIKQALISDNVQDVVNDIESRHQDILKLEKQVQEVFELFKDLATLVDLQQESLDVIENRIQSAKNYTEKGEADLQDAEKYQNKSRNRRCIILLIVTIILGIVIAVVFGTTFSES